MLSNDEATIIQNLTNKAAVALQCESNVKLKAALLNLFQIISGLEKIQISRQASLYFPPSLMHKIITSPLEINSAANGANGRLSKRCFVNICQ